MHFWRYFWSFVPLHNIDGLVMTMGKDGTYMDYKKMLHEVIDSLDNSVAERIYHLVMGVLGRKF